MAAVLFLSGVPASGKSTFGDWLQRERGCLHVDPENHKNWIPALREPWERALSSGDFIDFARSANALKTPVVFDWGFPIHLLWLARNLRVLGFCSWWFDADLSAARVAFLARGSGAIANFDVQANSIQIQRSEIHAAFAPNVIRTLCADGQRIPIGEIWSQIGKTFAV